MKHFLSEFIYGGMDGIITTIAVIAGTIGANISSKYALILGLANIISDGFSMGVSRYNSLIDINQSTNSITAKNNPLMSAIFTFIFFIVMGCIPLLPFLFIDYNDETLIKKMLFIFGVISFLIIGIIKGLHTKKLFKSIFEILIIGTISAYISFNVAFHVNKIML